MEEIYKRAETVPGTVSFHQFIPVYESIMGAKCVADDKYYAVQFDFNIVQLPGPGDTFSFSVCCMFV